MSVGGSSQILFDNWFFYGDAPQAWSSAVGGHWSERTKWASEAAERQRTAEGVLDFEFGLKKSSSHHRRNSL